MTGRDRYCYPYPRPMVTVDIACFAEYGGRTHILLIERGHDPFEGRWALPGGFVDENEPLERAALRELAEETGIPGAPIEQFRAYGDPGRDPRGHAVTVVYIARFPERAAAAGADDARSAGWFPTDSLPPLAFDHARIIGEALEHYGRGLGAGRGEAGARGRDHE
jgi:8-oxo-dGTP diphosphatase